MRIRFEPQLKIGQIAIKDTPVSLKGKDEIDDLFPALLYLFNNEELREKLFSFLDKYLNTPKNVASKNAGRKGLTLWQIFVMAQVRLCLKIDCAKLHNPVNNHRAFRILPGIEYEFGYPRVELDCQNIYDNVNLLTGVMLEDINDTVLKTGHQVFKKKEADGLRLKTDSFAVKSNVHYPIDYSLLWDCIRVLLRMICRLNRKSIRLPEWRKLRSWYTSLKSLSREVVQASKGGGTGKQDKVKRAVKQYVAASKRLLDKLQKTRPALSEQGADLLYRFDEFLKLMCKHIDLLERRILKEETIPHSEKLFSVFEQYTQYVTKGKFNPSVEFGKPVAITGDRFHLILQWKIYGAGDSDSSVAIAEKDRLEEKFIGCVISSRSYDRGFWSPTNRKVPGEVVKKVVMPRKGSCKQEQAQEEADREFKRLREKHSAVESNINELEHRGLSRCPDRGEEHFDRYAGLAVIACNLRRIGHEIRRQQLQALLRDRQRAQKQAA